MVEENVEPINATLVSVSVLWACAQLGCLDLGRWIYDNYIISGKVELAVNLGNAFIEMYAKGGDLDYLMRWEREM
uniref:Pentatricopeptide repeat-containing protein n=1 Tax=Aegilops tauschii subsp. strangulata TaxID=200361 RepID=A0A453IQW0_AEGTS